MSHQLWTSSITGNRRTGTRLSELRAIIDAGITARAIFEPLQCCLIDAPAMEMRLMLSQREFDIAGVQLECGGPVVGFVTTASLREGFVRDHMTPLTPAHLISEATPIPTLLSVLKTEAHVFVLVGPGVEGLVTRADLNKPPLRIYLFSILSLLEMHVTFWIRAESAGDALCGVLSDGRIKAAERIQAERKARRQETDLLDCLQFCDKRDLLLQRPDLCDTLNLSLPDAKERLEAAEALRNLLAHSQADLVSGSTWEELIDHIEWIEQLVHRSDDLVEQNAAMAAEKGLTGLWSAA